MAKIGLIVVKLPKFEAVNGKSWTPRTLVIKRRAAAAVPLPESP